MAKGLSGPRPTWRFYVREQDQTLALIDLLARETKLSKSLLKKVLLHGGVWLRRKDEKTRRVRRAQTALQLSDRVDVFYKEELLKPSELTPVLIKGRRHFGVWFKPVGMPTEATPYGDRGSFLFEVAKEYPKAHVWGRLDREVSGLVLCTYQSKAHKAQSENPTWQKFYLAVVKQGEKLATGESWETIKTPIEGQEAQTRYRVVERKGEWALVEVELITGRTHQIRRHFASLDLPLKGEGRWSQNPDHLDLHLLCYRFKLRDPLDSKGAIQDIVLDKAHWPVFFRDEWSFSYDS